MIRRVSSIIIQGFLVMILLNGCWNFFDPWAKKNQPEDPEEETIDSGSGAMLVRHGGYLYILGGLDDDGAPKAEVAAAPINAEGEVEGSWFNASPLPVPIAFGMSFATANYIYVLGGITAGGALSDRIYYAYVQPEGGALGFGEEGQWDTNLRNLPYGLARAALAIDDGHLYLAGGETPDGKSDAILYARLYRDGFVGYWYPAGCTLPGPRAGSGATIEYRDGDLRLVVAGGEKDDQPLDEVSLFSLKEHGILSDPEILDLPAALANPVVLFDADTVLVAGGYGTTGASSAIYSLAGGGWNTEQESITALGPSCGRAGGRLHYLEYSQAEPPEDGKVLIPGEKDLSLSPEAPGVLPGSGLVQNRSYVRLRAEPGTVVRYATAPEGERITDVTAADPEWPPAEPYRILENQEMAFRVFGLGGRTSPLIRRSYRVRSTGFFVDTKRLTVKSEMPDTHDLLAPGWYFFVMEESGTITVFFEDADTSVYPGVSTRVRISVFEPDLFTPVPQAVIGKRVMDLGSSASPVTVWLNAGTYYIEAFELTDSGGTGRFLLWLVAGTWSN